MCDARDRGIVVDVSFGEYGYSLEAYEAGIVAVAEALAEHRNALFDVANEHNYPDVGQTVLSPAEVVEIAMAVRAVDPDRLVTASTVCHVIDASCFALTGIEHTFASPHFARDATWALDTEGRIDALRAALQATGWDGPIYLQEENRYGLSLPAEAPVTEFFAAAGAAKAGFDADQSAAGGASTPTPGSTCRARACSTSCKRPILPGA